MPADAVTTKSRFHPPVAMAVTGPAAEAPISESLMLLLALGELLDAPSTAAHTLISSELIQFTNSMNTIDLPLDLITDLPKKSLRHGSIFERRNHDGINNEDSVAYEFKHIVSQETEEKTMQRLGSWLGEQESMEDTIAVLEQEGWFI